MVPKLIVPLLCVSVVHSHAPFTHCAAHTSFCSEWMRGCREIPLRKVNTVLSISMCALLCIVSNDGDTLKERKYKTDRKGEEKRWD